VQAVNLIGVVVGKLNSKATYCTCSCSECQYATLFGKGANKDVSCCSYIRMRSEDSVNKIITMAALSKLPFLVSRRSRPSCSTHSHEDLIVSNALSSNC
jgi:hypothetical protein